MCEAHVQAVVRELARTSVDMRLGDLASGAMPLLRGLRQGCSTSALLFRWVVEDVLSGVLPRWLTNGYAFALEDAVLSHLCWADDLVL